MLAKRQSRCGFVHFDRAKTLIVPCGAGKFHGGLWRCGQRFRKIYTGSCLPGSLFILSDGMAFHLAASGAFPIGQAFGLRLKTVGALYAF